MLKRKSKVICIVIVFLSFLLVFTTSWIRNVFGNVTLEEILFNFYVTQKGVNKSYIYSYILKAFLPIITMVILFYFLVLKKYKLGIELNVRIKKKIYKCIIFPFNKVLKIFIVSFIFVISILYTSKKLDLYKYIKRQISKSNLIENEYVEPKTTNISFENGKRNLIYIYLESMESSYSSIDKGGTQENDLIEELSVLASENISFSNTDKLGGALSAPGTTWTVAALVSHTSGLPLKLSVDGNKYGEYETFLPGAYTLGDILEENGYNQEIMFGSDASYAGRDNYFKQHGNYEIWDLNTAIKSGKMTEADKVWWGFEDKKLFEWSKEEILKLAAKDEPFNFTLLTADTHFEDGYLSEYCNPKYDEQYSSVIACSSALVYDFINWIKNQDFYDNTTIIISGDHLTMDTNFFENVSLSYERTIYNVFINSAVSTKNTNNRLFTTMDMLPTTLASLGATIEGDKLGIGTNLYSNKKTLMEKYGVDVIREELSKTSTFYNYKFLYNK